MQFIVKVKMQICNIHNKIGFIFLIYILISV